MRFPAVDRAKLIIASSPVFPRCMLSRICGMRAPTLIATPTNTCTPTHCVIAAKLKHMQRLCDAIHVQEDTVGPLWAILVVEHERFRWGQL